MCPVGRTAPFLLSEYRFDKDTLVRELRLYWTAI